MEQVLLHILRTQEKNTEQRLKIDSYQLSTSASKIFWLLRKSFLINVLIYRTGATVSFDGNDRTNAAEVNPNLI